MLLPLMPECPSRLPLAGKFPPDEIINGRDICMIAGMTSPLGSYLPELVDV